MKAIYILLSVVLTGILFGCDDFLERSAQNMIVPEKVEHYRELLQGDAYFKGLYDKTAWVQFMTDDAEFQECYSRFNNYDNTGDNLEHYSYVYTGNLI